MLQRLSRAIRALEGRTIDTLNRKLGRFSLTYMIYGIHIRRLGLLRASFGGTSQYLAIPLFFHDHLNLLLLHHALLRRLPPVDWRR